MLFPPWWTSWPASSTKFIIPTEIGLQSVVLVTRIGQANEFQDTMNVNTRMTIKGALDKGMAIWNKKRR